MVLVYLFKTRKSGTFSPPLSAPQQFRYDRILCIYWSTETLDKYGRVAAAHYGEARAHARPARRGARSTPRGYAPLESSGNGCLRQPMQTFFYCDSHESQQRGKTPRVKMLVKVFKKHMAHEPCESKYIIHIPEIMFKLFSF